MAGSGDLDCLRLLRVLRNRIGGELTYGEKFLFILLTLFLGGCFGGFFQYFCIVFWMVFSPISIDFFGPFWRIFNTCFCGTCGTHVG